MSLHYFAKLSWRVFNISHLERVWLTGDVTEYWWWVKTRLLFQAFVDHKFMIFWDDVVSNAIARLSMSCFPQKIFPLSVEVLEKRNKCKEFFGSNFSTTPTFLRQIDSAIYFPPGAVVEKNIWGQHPIKLRLKRRPVVSAEGGRIEVPKDVIWTANGRKNRQNYSTAVESVL